jgi:hypothetical protein
LEKGNLWVDPLAIGQLNDHHSVWVDLSNQPIHRLLQFLVRAGWLASRWAGGIGPHASRNIESIQTYS